MGTRDQEKAENAAATVREGLCSARRNGQPFDLAWPVALRAALADVTGEDATTWRLALDWARPAFEAAYHREPSAAPTLAAAPLERTRYQGIYRRGSRYVVRYRAGGRHRSEAVRTLEEARRLKRAREADHDRGEFQEQSRVPFREYAEEWIERHHGRKGFRESTRDDYRRDLRTYAYPFFDERLERTVSQISPRDVANFIAWLCDPNGMAEVARARAVEQAREKGKPPPKRKRSEVRLSDQTVRRILAPVRSCFATAVREGLISHNPATGAALLHRAGEEADHGEVRALTREQLIAFLDLVHPQHRTMFRLLAATGLRWSEVSALRWQDLALDGSRPRVEVRRALVRGRYGPPKSKHSRRDVPLSADLVSELRARRKASDWGKDDDLVFASVIGTPLDHSNLMSRVLRPVAQEVAAPWAGFHTLRHTCGCGRALRGRQARYSKKGYRVAMVTAGLESHARRALQETATRRPSRQGRASST